MAVKVAPRRGASIHRLQAPVTLAYPGAAYWVSGALAVVAAITGALTFFAPGVLRGTAVMNGSARGTAVALLALALPTLILSMIFAARGSVRAIVAWLGSLAYVVYNAVLFLFATPFNRLFLLYVATFALSFWATLSLLTAIDIRTFRSRFSATTPVRTLAVVMLAIMVLNAGAWLMSVIPAIVRGGAPRFLEGTGLTTNPIYVQDLSFWIPLMAVAAVSLWQRRAWGYLLVGALLTFGVIETLGVGIDQWFGASADPASPVAAAILLPISVIVAAIELIPLYIYYRSLARIERPRT